MENSGALGSMRFQKIRRKLLRRVGGAGYHVWWKVLNSKRHAGVPQNRSRFFLIAIKREALVHNFSFPSAITPVPFHNLLESGLIPWSLPGLPSRGEEIVKRGLAKLSAKGVEPTANTPCIVDAHASAGFSSSMATVSPALTATRCQANGHYISYLQRFMYISEMARLQGYPWSASKCLQILSDMRAASPHMSEQMAQRRLKHALGNAITCTMLVRLLPRVLRCAGLLDVKLATPGYAEIADGFARISLR